MSRQALPPGFEEGRDPTPEDLESLPAIALDAVHVLERCMVEHHIAEVDYTEPDERQETIRVGPRSSAPARLRTLLPGVTRKAPIIGSSSDSTESAPCATRE